MKSSISNSLPRLLGLVGLVLSGTAVTVAEYVDSAYQTELPRTRVCIPSHAHGDAPDAACIRTRQPDCPCARATS
ncbi:MAG: hypothetical protein GY711_22670 [bacterium]|nr:hypothetical protein [bacterium]